MIQKRLTKLQAFYKVINVYRVNTLIQACSSIYSFPNKLFVMLNVDKQILDKFIIRDFLLQTTKN